MTPAFEDSFRAGFGGCVMDCHCGRTCFDDSSNSYDWDSGELETLRLRSDQEPDKCVALAHACSALTIDGKTFVLGCPCGGPVAYEKFLRNHAEQIAKFLVAVRKERLEYAEALKMADLLANFPPEPIDPGYPAHNYGRP